LKTVEKLDIYTTHNITLRYLHRKNQEKTYSWFHVRWW